MSIELTEEHDIFLRELRDSGVTNMWGAAPWIEDEFGVSPKEAKQILLAWIKSFDKERVDES